MATFIKFIHLNVSFCLSVLLCYYFSPYAGMGWSCVLWFCDGCPSSSSSIDFSVKGHSFSYI